MVSDGVSTAAVSGSGPFDLSSARRRRTGQILLLAASALLVLVLFLQVANTTGIVRVGFTDWRPLIYAYVVWGVALGVRQVLVHGERGWRALWASKNGRPASEAPNLSDSVLDSIVSAIEV